MAQSIYALYGFFDPIISLDNLNGIKMGLDFESLLKYKNKDKAVIGATINIEGEITVDELDRVGLVEGHSYLILNLKTYKGKNFIQLRNPWAEYEWCGDYSDHSSLWTSDMKREFGLVEQNDGHFWMCEKDFFHYFNKFEVIGPIPNNMHKKHIKYSIPRSSEKVDLESLEQQI